MTDYLFALIQVAMGNRKELPAVLPEEQWYGIRKQSEQQRLLGMAFVGIEKLPSEQKPSKHILLEWAMQTELLKKANERRNYLCQRAFAQLKENQLTAVVLKGQANCYYYPADLKMVRMPGDLDIWIGDCFKEAVRYVYSYTKPQEGIRYNHIDFPILGDVPVELHYRPVFLCNPLYNYRLQRWFKQQWKKQPWTEHDGFLIANTQFNIVYMLIHMYRHLFEENIGFRQIIDYIYVLRNRTKDISDAEIMNTLEYLGLERFAKATMYILTQVDPAVPVYCQPDPQHGAFLLKEIMKERRKRNKTFIDIHLFPHYPGEAFCEPFFRLWHAIWRLVQRFRLRFILR